MDSTRWRSSRSTGTKSCLSSPTPLKGWTSKWVLLLIPVLWNMAPFIYV
jgi:hypothetical protein